MSNLTEIERLAGVDMKMSPATRYQLTQSYLEEGLDDHESESCRKLSNIAELYKMPLDYLVSLLKDAQTLHCLQLSGFDISEVKLDSLTNEQLTSILN